MRRELHSHPVSGTQSHKIHLGSASRMRHHQILIRQLQPVGGAGQKFHHGRFFLAPGPWPPALHGLVSTHGPLEVTATVCSK